MDLVTAWPAGKHEKAKVVKHSSAGYDDPDFVGYTSVDSAPPAPLRRNRPLSSAILGSSTVQDPTIRGVQFDMHLSNEATSTKTHIYTSIQSEIGSAARTLEQVPNWQIMFPQLAIRYNEGRIDCPLFFFESRLRLINDIRVGLSLGIEFAIDFAEGGHSHDWRSLTRIHKQDITRQYFEDSEFEETWDRLECLESSNGQSDIQLTIPFKSKWWVKLFSSIISERDVARNAKDREAVKYADECAAAHLRELSIMQELWATPKGGSSQRPQRMATLLWTFSQSRNGEAATTTWRPLTLSTSASPYQVQEPVLRGMQPSMNLDSTLQESMAPAQPDAGQQQPSAFYNVSRHSVPNRGSLFSETSEALLTSHLSECDTEATTPILDYTSSFPSSTSASFPSSISNNSGYPSHHGSSFDSQDGRSSYTQSLESSFHSQQSTRDPNNATVYGMPPHSTNSYKPHEATYSDPQDMLFSSQTNSMYGNMHEYPSFSHRSSVDDPTLVVQPTHQTDFTSGAVHLAYAGQQGTTTDQLSPTEDSGFQVPLIAPRANLLPQQQVGECLQSFESWVPPPRPTTANTPAVVMARQQRRQHGANDMHNETQEEEGEEAEEEDNNEDEGEDDSEQLCGNGQRQSISYHPINHHLQQAQHQPQHQQPVYQQRQRLATPAHQADIQTEQSQHQDHHQHGASEVGQVHPNESDDLETQRQHQLQYLHDAHDHWEHSFHPALWPLPGLQMPGSGAGGGDAADEENSAMDTGDQLEGNSGALMKVGFGQQQVSQDQDHGRVLGEIRERIQEMEALVERGEWSMG